MQALINHKENAPDGAAPFFRDRNNVFCHFRRRFPESSGRFLTEKTGFMRSAAQLLLASLFSEKKETLAGQCLADVLADDDRGASGATHYDRKPVSREKLKWAQSCAFEVLYWGV